MDKKSKVWGKIKHIAKLLSKTCLGLCNSLAILFVFTFLFIFLGDYSFISSKLSLIASIGITILIGIVEYKIISYRKSKTFKQLFFNIEGFYFTIGLVTGVMILFLVTTQFMVVKKPALYLYPEVETNFSVDVEGMDVTRSIPRYDGGWDVSVEPSGLIDGRFDYIYFEGRTVLEEPDKGWVVKYSRLDSFLYNLSVEKGLVGSEAEDLTEYWSRALPKSKYYFVSYIPGDELESSYSVNIEPEPDTFIRQIYYFKPLDSWVDVEEPVFNSVERNGTVAVEWGGVLGSKSKFKGIWKTLGQNKFLG